MGVSEYKVELEMEREFEDRFHRFYECSECFCSMKYTGEPDRKCQSCIEEESYVSEKCQECRGVDGHYRWCVEAPEYDDNGFETYAFGFVPDFYTFEMLEAARSTR